jgi:hypothetical protein
MLSQICSCAREYSTCSIYPQCCRQWHLHRGSRRASHQNRAASHGNKNFKLGSSIGTLFSNDRVTKRGEHRPSQESESPNQVLVAHNELGNRRGRNEIDCSICEHHLMHTPVVHHVEATAYVLCLKPGNISTRIVPARMAAFPPS